MTRSEAIEELKLFKESAIPWDVPILLTAIDMAIEALEREDTDEWCTDCKEYDTEKKCCPRFNKVIREAMKRVPHEDGTLEVKVEDATKVGRVLISDDEHRGGLYYPDEDEPKGDDLISRAEAYTRIAELSRDLLNDDCINLGNASEYLRIIRELPSADRPTDGDQWRADIEAIKSVPSTDRPRGEWVFRRELVEDTPFTGYRCSNCNYWQGMGSWNFCPRCGADMRGDTE